MVAFPCSSPVPNGTYSFIASAPGNNTGAGDRVGAGVDKVAADVTTGTGVWVCTAGDVLVHPEKRSTTQSTPKNMMVGKYFIQSLRFTKVHVTCSAMFLLWKTIRNYHFSSCQVTGIYREFVYKAYLILQNPEQWNVISGNYWFMWRFFKVRQELSWQGRRFHGTWTALAIIPFFIHISLLFSRVPFRVDDAP